VTHSPAAQPRKRAEGSIWKCFSSCFLKKKIPDEQDQMLNAKMIKPRQELYTGPTDIMIRVTSPKILLKRSIFGTFIISHLGS